MSFDYHIQKKLSLYPLLAIAFAMPLLPKLIPALIIIWFITWFVDEPVGNKIDRISHNKFIWVFIVFYLIHVLAMLYTSNNPVGKFDLEVKTALWFLPILFAGASRLIYEKLNQVFYAFIAGVVTASIICITTVLIKNNIHEFYYISYTQLSFILHPSYFALYINVCIGFLMIALMSPQNHYSNVTKTSIILLIVYLSAFIFMLSSKAGILSTALTIMIPLVIVLLKKKRIIYIVFMFLVAGLLCFAILTNSRFKELFVANQLAHTSKNTSESSAVRILVWESAIDIIKANPLLGVGTGDIKDELSTKYEENNISSALLDKLNVHNQFLETQLGQGILGFSCLLLIFIMGIKTAFKQTDYVMLIFFTLCAFNFLFESMLNTQAGVVFFAFMSGLFFIRLKKTD